MRKRPSWKRAARARSAAETPAAVNALSAFSLASFAGSIAGIASGLPLFFHGDFPRGPLSEFHIAGLLLGLQGGLTSGSLGGLCRGQGCSLLGFNGEGRDPRRQELILQLLEDLTRLSSWLGDCFL